MLAFAGSGRGKSHLCSQIISHLKKKKEEQGRKSVIRVAWHYFREAPKSAKASVSKGTKSVEGSNAHHRLVDALRVLIWQLAESDTHFQTFLIKELSRNRHFSSKSVDLWTTIIEKPQKVFDLILDGHGTSESDTSREDNAAITRNKRDISENRKRDVQVRLLWLNSEPLEPSNTADISLDDQDWDVETFIQHHLKESKEAWSQGSEEQ
ncbi:neutral amino acid permease [Macrophomina phaseolina MS6]|uniref:Neutral amino acid permease n=1 Tax=Macrophomina phaseolina (strain MS6) TaxID=1126212 RepID=K2SMM5_MACPH|nr:neutral amino acid permease [Macrophomina phaseolina MS6]